MFCLLWVRKWILNSCSSWIKNGYYFQLIILCPVFSTVWKIHCSKTGQQRVNFINLQGVSSKSCEMKHLHKKVSATLWPNVFLMPWSIQSFNIPPLATHEHLTAPCAPNLSLILPFTKRLMIKSNNYWTIELWWCSLIIQVKVMLK